LHAHLVAAFPRCGYCVESHGAPDRDPVWFGMFKERARIRDSHVFLSDRPGFGIEIDWDFVGAHRA
ncbi:MAG: mandelate racemase/muconate lactonizing enzyme family protein, partial [Betaproteobacteria bacterium]|nr:mandelate racemase/muconate lactonizing enzyme family protein [Betaproteobacteria bacterium]